MSDNIIVSKPENLIDFKQAVMKEGIDSLQVLADFDKTLTKAHVNGRKIPSIISQLRDGNYLTPDYSAKARALYEKYRPIEVDPIISAQTKKEKMQEWWQTHYELLLNSGLSYQDIEKVVQTDNVQFREGALEFFDILQVKQIPLVILSGSGLGDAIPLYFKKVGKDYDNIQIISNFFNWDSQGRAVSVKQPIIHTLNKNETMVKNYPAYEKIKDRKNVLLLGDGLEDVKMIDGFAYDNLLKVGFLNDEIDSNLDYYKDDYDVVLLNDSGMNYLNDLIKELATA